MLGLAVAKSDDLATMFYFAGLLDAALNTDMSFHREYANRFGITKQELEAEAKSPVTQAYSDFLLVVSYTGGVPELIAALLPCLWIYLEIGTRLKETGVTGEGNPYRRWIEIYSSQELKILCKQTRALLDRLAAGCPPEKKKRLEKIFIAGSRFEYLFWETAYNLGNVKLNISPTILTDHYR